MTALSNREQFGELMVMPGDWGLPSIDLRCLTVMAYVRFTGAPIQFTNCEGPKSLVENDLPVYVAPGDEQVKGSAQCIIQYLRSNHITADFDLSPASCADVIAYGHMLERKILPGLLYAFWVDKKNYDSFTRPWYAASLPFYYRWFIPLRMQSKAQGRIFSLFDMERISEEELESKVYENAKDGLTILSNKLGDNEYLLGASPTSLDAIVFGYVATVAKIPFPNAPLHQHLVNKCPNLIDYMERIINVYFPECAPVSMNGRSNGQQRSGGQNTTAPPPQPAGEFTHPLRDKLLFGGLALVAFAVYALASGLVQVQYERVDDDDDSESSGDTISVEDSGSE